MYDWITSIPYQHSNKQATKDTNFIIMTGGGSTKKPFNWIDYNWMKLGPTSQYPSITCTEGLSLMFPCKYTNLENKQVDGFPGANIAAPTTNGPNMLTMFMGMDEFQISVINIIPPGK